ncbi:MAG TPA: DUF1570 domain-containing protein [Planctomycetota bacterium]|nr:DUF1570 domain-containing protein [Planctomycetota bacterium]
MPWILLALLVATPPAPAVQGGYTKEKYPELGIELERPRDYEQIPTQPDEEFIVLHFAEKLPKDSDERREVRPEVWVVSIDFVPDPAALSPGSEPGPGTGDETGEEHSKDSGPGLPLNSLQRWLERRSPWTIVSSKPAKDRKGWSASVHALGPKPGVRDLDDAWCFTYERPGERTVAFIAICAPEDLEQQQRIWRRMAERCDLSEPADTDVEKLQLKYARARLRGVDYRIGVRSKLVRGWKAEDTENFIIVHHTADQPLIRSLVADIESIRKEYMRLFPPVGEITAVSTVRVCKDREEYLAYGGAPTSAGYWNANTEELVFYDAAASAQGKRRSGDENTFIVLYHEAFHQFIHYSVGELPPHSWFNEGHGDYFSGADVHGGKVRKIGVNPWRIELIQSAIEKRKHVPWRDILAFEQADYYRRDRAALCYAQGWSMIYFLRTSRDAARHPQWSRMLDTYFEALKQDYARRIGELTAQGRASERDARAEAGLAARKHALERACEGLDLDELEAAWADYVARIEFKRRD